MAGKSQKRSMWCASGNKKIVFRTVNGKTNEHQIACQTEFILCAAYLFCLVIRLISENIKLHTDLAYLKYRNMQLTEQVRRMTREKYVGKGAQTLTPYEGEQTFMQEVMEFIQKQIEPEHTEDEETVTVSVHKRKKKKRGPSIVNLLEGILEEERKEYYPEDMTCPECQEELKIIGKSEERRTLLIIPAQLKVLVETTYSAKCENCDKNGISTHVVSGEMPRALIPGSFASVSLVAYIAMSKMQMGVPVYRMEKYFNYQGIPLSRATMNSWLIKVGQLLIAYIDRMSYWLRKEEVLYGDETTCKYPDPEKKGPMKTGYIWVVATSRYSEHQLVVFRFHEGRNAHYHRDYIDGFQGYFHSDGFCPYHDNEGIISVGCQAHARDKFVIAKKDSSFMGYGQLAEEGVKYYDRIAYIENKIKDIDLVKKLLIRNEKVKPIMDSLHTWVLENRGKVLPKSDLGKAMTYTMNQWKYMYNIFLDGRLDATNNFAERIIKSYVLARKNFLFVQNSCGGYATAAFASLAATAVANQIDPFKFTVWVLDHLRSKGACTPEELDEFMVWNAPESFKIPMIPNKCIPCGAKGMVSLAF